MRRQNESAAVTEKSPVITDGGASMRDVASRAGVSVGTVSNFLNHPEKLAAATAARVSAAIDELGFVRNDAARQLRAGHSRAIGLVVLNFRNPFFSELAIGAEERARESGYALVLGNSDANSDLEASYLDLFEEQRMHGVLITPFGDVESRLRKLKHRGIPAVLVDRVSSTSEFSSVSVDDVAGGRLAGEHLVAIGRKRIAYLGGPLDIRQVQDRLLGLQQVAERHDDVRIEILTGSSPTVLEGRRLGDHLASRSPRDRPDAVFAANDLLALGALQALVMSGRIRVPRDIALVGFDDIQFASNAVVPLTSVRQPTARMGRSAVEVLLDQAEGGIEPGLELVFAPQLIVRASTVEAGEAH